MGREFELKYQATPSQIDAVRETFGGFSPIAMETTYFDTPDGALSRLRWTLRRRMENRRSVCTLKTPLPDGSRAEWETETESIEEAIPELCKLSRSRQLLVLTAGGIVPSCGARFTRLAKTLTFDDFSVELALDQGVLLGGGRELAFAEIEVELKEGSDESAIAFARALAAEFGLTPEPKSKVRRAQELAKA